MRYEEIKKLNIGSARKKMDGFINLDALPWDGNTDLVWDITDTPYPFESGQIEEIVCMETLEHISFNDTAKVLNEFNRLLKKGGKLSIQVPDCGRMMEYYINKQVCRCVNHKDTGDGFNADPNCPECGGKAIINPVRWQFAFTGAQKHFPHDIHKMIFTKEILEDYLRDARFHRFEYKEHIYKLKVNCYK